MSAMVAGRLMTDLMQQRYEVTDQDLDGLLVEAAGGNAELQDLLIQVKNLGLAATDVLIENHINSLTGLLPDDYLQVARAEAKNSARMAAAALGETPKALSLAPMRAAKVRPRCRSIASGPTKGTVAGRLRTSAVKGISSWDMEGSPHLALPRRSISGGAGASKAAFPASAVGCAGLWPAR